VPVLTRKLIRFNTFWTFIKPLSDWNQKMVMAQPHWTWMEMPAAWTKIHSNWLVGKLI
jgi:hypothetical protein